MRIIPKAQYGRQLIVQSDNTHVARPVIERKIQYKLKPGEFFFTDRNTGKKTLIKPKNETISTDRRSTYQRKQDEKRTQQLHRQYEEDKKQEEGIKNLQGFLTFISPSTYIGPVFNNNGKSYTENVMSGEGTGDVAGNVAIDMLTPFAVGGTRSLAINTAKRFPYRLWIPRNSNKYYRIVGSPTAKAGDAIADANNTGFLRSSSLASSAEPIDKGAISLHPKTFDYLMFSKGKPWTGSTNGVGFGGHLNNGQRVIVSKADTGPIKWEESNVDFRHKGHKGIFRPNYNGNLEQIPTNYFEYYERGSGPITRHLWRKKQFESPAQLDLDFQYHGGTDKIQKVFSSLIMRGKMPGTLGMKITPLETVDDEVSRIMQYQVFNRLGISSPQEFYSDIYQGSTGLMKSYHPRMQGVNFPGERIVIKEGIPQVEVLPHELRHRLDDTHPLSSEQQHILNKAYSDDFNSDEIKKAVNYDSSYDMSKEAVTTNLDSRIKALESYSPGYNYIDKLASLSEQNKIIDELTYGSIINAVQNSNGYGQAYINYLKQNNLLTKDKVQAFRNAMKYVGGVSVPITSGINTQR